MNKKLVYAVLGEFLLIIVGMFYIVWICSFDFTESFNRMSYFIDIPSLLGLLVLVIPTLIFSGNGKGFLRSFCVGEKKFTVLELKNIVDALENTQKICACAGFMEALIGIILTFGSLNVPEQIGANLAVAVISLMYMCIVQLLLLPLKANAVRTLNREIDMDLINED